VSAEIGPARSFLGKPFVRIGGVLCPHDTARLHRRCGPSGKVIVPIVTKGEHQADHGDPADHSATRPRCCGQPLAADVERPCYPGCKNLPSFELFLNACVSEARAEGQFSVTVVDTSGPIDAQVFLVLRDGGYQAGESKDGIFTFTKPVKSAPLLAAALERVMNFLTNKAVLCIEYQALSLGWHIKHEALEPITQAMSAMRNGRFALRI
jgi:hypothetical protein